MGPKSVNPAKRMNHDQMVNFLAGRILEIKIGHPLRVVLEGREAAGKTTLLRELCKALESSGRQIIQAGCTGFHNPRATRYAKGRNSPEGYYYDSYNWQGLIDNLLKPLGPEGNRLYRSAIFDYRTDRRVEMKWRKSADDAILVYDTPFSFNPQIVNYWDLKILLDITEDTSVGRAMQRKRDLKYIGDEREVEKLYRERYVAGQKIYMSEVDVYKTSNIIVNYNDFENPIIVKS